MTQAKDKTLVLRTTPENCHQHIAAMGPNIRIGAVAVSDIITQEDFEELFDRYNGLSTGVSAAKLPKRLGLLLDNLVKVMTDTDPELAIGVISHHYLTTHDTVGGQGEHMGFSGSYTVPRLWISDKPAIWRLRREFEADDVMGPAQDKSRTPRPFPYAPTNYYTPDSTGVLFYDGANTRLNYSGAMHQVLAPQSLQRRFITIDTYLD